MIYATFSDSMVSMLKSFIGCEFNVQRYVSIGNGVMGICAFRQMGNPMKSEISRVVL